MYYNLFSLLLRSRFKANLKKLVTFGLFSILLRYFLQLLVPGFIVSDDQGD